MYCDKCEYLLCTENEQNIEKAFGRKVNHICRILKCRLFHLTEHPRILKDKNCPNQEVNNETK